MSRQIITGLAIGVLSLIMAGCSHYYRVTDPISGKTYYTTDIDERSGRVKFKDDRTRNIVILHAAELSEMSEDEYGAEVKGTSSLVIPPPVATRSADGTEAYR
jgi:hypothetical protein